MNPLNKKLDYLPSIEILRLWLRTYTTESAYSGVKLPGLFKVNLFPLHFFFFIIVILGEFYGWYVIRSIATAEINSVFIGLIIVDLALVVLAYFIVGRIKLVRNQLLLLTNEGKIASLKSSIFPFKLLLFIIKSAFVFVAIIKIISYLDLNRITISEILEYTDLIPVIILYIIVAALHITSSVYFIAYAVLYARLKINQNKGIENIIKHKTSVFSKPINFDEAKVMSGTSSHYLTKKVFDDNLNLVEDINPNTKDFFKLHTWGLLLDEQLDEIVWAQTKPEMKREVALFCLAHQLDMLNAKP